MKRLFKIISLALVLIIILTSLLSCSARPLAQSKLAKKVVGTVGSHDVYYEELYFLANGYKNVAKENHGDDSEALNKAILDYVSENIIENYAVLDLCAAEGLEYNERKLRSSSFGARSEIQVLLRKRKPRGRNKGAFENQEADSFIWHYSS